MVAGMDDEPFGRVDRESARQYLSGAYQRLDDRDIL